MTELKFLTEPVVMEHEFDDNKTFVENLHDCIKENNYKFGKDYIEVDLGEYIAFCPFNFYILNSFRGFFYHCVTLEEKMWNDYFETSFFWWGDLKAFFFKKSTLRKEMLSDDMWEFTCWISVRQCRMGQNKHSVTSDLGDNFYLFHDHRNRMQCNAMSRELIEKNYDKIVKCFMDSYTYKHLKPSKL